MVFMYCFCCFLGFSCCCEGCFRCVRCFFCCCVEYPLVLVLMVLLFQFVFALYFWFQGGMRHLEGGRRTQHDSRAGTSNGTEGSGAEAAICSCGISCSNGYIRTVYFTSNHQGLLHLQQRLRMAPTTIGAAGASLEQRRGSIYSHRLCGNEHPVYKYKGKTRTGTRIRQYEVSTLLYTVW